MGTEIGFELGLSPAKDLSHFVSFAMSGFPDKLVVSLGAQLSALWGERGEREDSGKAGRRCTLIVSHHSASGWGGVWWVQSESVHFEDDVSAAPSDLLTLQGKASV